MRVSHYFWAVLREVPEEAKIVSHRLMLQAGLVQQMAAGIYTWLPLGLRVLRKIEHIVRQEQERAGYVEILAPTLQPVTLWHKSGRYDDYGKEMLRLKDRHERELVYGPTAEEVFTEVFSTHVHSYKQLPQRLYNIQWKFRDEVRPRFGVMRGREFLMKDAYSFDLTMEAAHESYRNIFNAYLRTFARMDLKVIPVRAGTGPIGGDLSHEFQILAETGESMLYYDSVLADHKATSMEDFKGVYAMADDEHKPEECPIPTERLKTSRGIEVGHVFYFGTKYSQPLGACVTNRSGERVPVEMGSYGIGVSRLVGAIIEAFHDSRGICWPDSVAPFTVGLMALGASPEARVLADTYYETLLNRGIDVLYHDIECSAGERFADLDLVGCPYQVIFSERNADSVEIKTRKTGKSQVFSYEESLNWLDERLASVAPLGVGAGGPSECIGTLRS